MTRSEDLSYFWIHIDHHVLFCFDLVISLLHLRLNPFSERISNDGIYDVGDILPGQLLHLFFNREVPGYLRISTSEHLHILDSQTLELWHIDVLGLVALDPLLGSRLNVLQMPNSDILEGWEEDMDLRGQEAIYFSLALEFGSKFRRSYLRVLVEDLSLSSGSRYLVGVIHHRVK